MRKYQRFLLEFTGKYIYNISYNIIFGRSDFVSRLKGLKYTIIETDLVLLFTCILTSAFGILMVYSATMSKLKEGELLDRDCIIMIAAVALGLAGCIVISLLDYEAFIRLWPVVGGISIILMVLLFFIGDAPSDRPDAICWINIPLGAGRSVSLQPSELVKIGFIITFTAHIDAVKDDINSLKNVLLLCLHGIVPVGLVILTGDLGSALVFVAIFVAMMFIAGVNFRYFIAAAVAGIVASPILWVKFFSEYQKKRFLAVYWPSALEEAEYKTFIFQQQRCVNAIGSGRLLGSGLFKGAYTQNNAVPVQESDMIFSVVGEELGFVGAVCLLLVMAFIILRVASTARKSRNLTGSLLCYGIAFMIGSQIIINIGVCLKALPCIGITLPFISSGGSANLCIYLAIGIVLSVYRFNTNRTPVNFRLSHISTPFSES